MRLIDADEESGKLIDYITEHDVEIIYALKSKDSTALEEAMFEYFDSQKVAYDVDKVVEQLEEERRKSVEMLREDKGTAFQFSSEARKRAIERSIKIVKAGGVNE